MNEIKYPDVEVQLSGRDGNAFGIIARVIKALKRAGVPADEVEAFKTEAMSGDYGHVLRTASDWVSIS